MIWSPDSVTNIMMTIQILHLIYKQANLIVSKSSGCISLLKRVLCGFAVDLLFMT